jgi:hypothetical protein
VERSREWLETQNGSLSQISAHMDGDDPESQRKRQQRRAKARRSEQTPRRSIRLASCDQIPDHGIRRVRERSRTGRRVQFANPRTRNTVDPVKPNGTIPETPARFLPSSSLPVFRDESDVQINHFEEVAPLAIGETIISSPPIPRPEPPKSSSLKRKRIEAEMHRLLAEENDHKRQAEEFRAQAARHERKALTLRIQMEEMDVELGSDPSDPG